MDPFLLFLVFVEILMNVNLIVIEEAETVDRFSGFFAAGVEHVGYLDDDLDGKAALFVLVEDESLAVIREADLQPAFHEQEGDLDISDVGVRIISINAAK